MALFWGILSAQVEVNYSYEMKYGDGKEVEAISQHTTDYSYFENILDINTSFGDKLYLFTQFEYSDPPVFGHQKNGLNAFYLEYQNDYFNLKLGDLYELYGRGLSFYTFQDQNIDYDNAITGLRLNYYFDSNIFFSGLLGAKDYQFKFYPLSREAESFSHMQNNIALLSINLENDIIGTTQYLIKNQNSVIESDLIDKIFFLTTKKIGSELSNRALSYYQQGITDTIYTFEHNLNWYNSFGPFEIYLDKVWNRYTKIYGNEVFGSRFYTSIYTDFLGIGITYEYKDYFMPYLIKSLTNPPIVYRESNSILASRNVHSMNFGNEIGHQIDINKKIIDNMNVAANLSLAHRHQLDKMEPISFFDILYMKEEDYMYQYNPFRQFYLEFNGWALSEQLYYKVGIDHFTEFFEGKNTSAFTIPTQWVWKLSNGDAITIYLESQIKNSGGKYDQDPEKYTCNYFSSSYSIKGQWILTGFYDQEIKDTKSSEWKGADLSYKLNSATQISIYYGSQKGGLICANGICAQQPGFEDGIKVTFRSLF